MQKGITLFETLLALFLLSVSLLGLAHLNVLSLHAYHLAYQNSVATSQVFSIIQRLKANYPRQSQEILHWNEQNRVVLPQGRGNVSCEGTLCKIQLHWLYQARRVLSVTVQNPTSTRD